MARSFETFDVVRLKQSLFNLPKHTIGKVMAQHVETVHVIFTGFGMAILHHSDIELIPQVKDNVREQLSLFDDSDLVEAKINGDNVLLTKFLGTSDNIEPEDPGTVVVATKKQLWLAYIKSTCWDEFTQRVGLNVVSK